MTASIGLRKRKREELDADGQHVSKGAVSNGLSTDNTHTSLHEKLPVPKNRATPTPVNKGGDAHRCRLLRTVTDPYSIQIVAGSYERVLHGITVTIPAAKVRSKTQAQTDGGATNGHESASEDVSFSDTFLFAAHTSSIRCLALSPPTGSDKRLLSTGGSDERINLYSISTIPPALNSMSNLPNSVGAKVAENAKNRDIGSLIHHDRAITRMHFPSKGKLFSAAEDNTIAISRTRDWTMLSSIKAPIPKQQGRPSGDTAAPGEVPAGVNDFAVHPSSKLMLSVGRGERCMRLWNLMTGKKAGVLSFSKSLLQQVGEGRYGSGEGRRLLWDEVGESYVVGFERGAAIFGIDSLPRAVIRPSPSTKLHQMQLLPSSAAGKVLAASTEDGRILFFDASSSPVDVNAQSLQNCICLAQLGGAAAGISGRIKDFEILELPAIGDEAQPLLIAAGSSDGLIRLWLVQSNEIKTDVAESVNGETTKYKSGEGPAKQVGTLIGSHETGNRITCLTAFVMDLAPKSDAAANGDAERGADDSLEDDEQNSDTGI